MEGSSDSKWQRSETSRGLLDSSSDRRRFRSDRIRLAIDPSDNKERDYSGFDRASLGVSGVSVDEKTAAAAAGEWNNDVSLRQWLDNPERTVDSFECLHVFIQIVEIVNLAHKQGVVVHNVRPSCFIMSSFNRISFIESASCSDSGSDSIDDVAELKGGSSSSPLPAAADNPNFHFPMKQLLIMETNWYTSPEEANGDSSSCASDIYRLGVLLFELFCAFHTAEEKSSTMYSLRHRVLPPQLLLKWPKEASFCLWLLHPDPNSRPKMGELLRSEFLTEPRDTMDERMAAIELREKIEEQELLLEFLLLLQQRKQEVSDNLKDTISFISSDIEEVEKQQTALSRQGSDQELIKESTSGLISTDVIENDDSTCSGSRKRFRQVKNQLSSSGEPTNDNSFSNRNSKLAKNFRKLEAAYFLTRQRLVKQQQQQQQLVGKSVSRNSSGRGSIVVSERSSVNDILPTTTTTRQSGWINSFLEGLCKYHAFDKLKVKADMKQGDLLNSSNLVCSLSFDRDGEFFATAGINKKIKIFEYNSILNDDRDIHYPVVELASRSKLSSICWNSYIKNQIASSNFDGIVQVWDAARSQVFMEMREHEKRVWSVDFSLSDPTMLASGSDDGTVKLWNINQGVSVGTIKTKANVCCVQFPVDSGRTIAFGSADHRIYYYDLRNTKMPLCTLIGHNKTVSYVKFVDSKSLVSSSTDNTLKLWDLSMGTSRVLDTPLHSFTGHTNVKNFVGLSVSEGYIATGSETNEVFVYHKAFPMPALSFKFGNAEAVAGDEADDAAQFISSVCWRGQSPTLVAANSMGNIKLLEMV